MAIFRKKPVVIEAFRLGIDIIPVWCMMILDQIAKDMLEGEK